MRIPLLLALLFCVAAPALAKAPGIRLHFQVDRRYLALHCLSGRFGLGDRTLLEAFQDRALRFDREACRFLFKYDWPVGDLSVRGEMGERAERLITHLEEDPAFATLEAETRTAASQAEQEWNQDLEFSQGVMRDLTGIKFDMDLYVLITHPGQRNGMSFGETKILWTYRNDFPHFNTVYLWHEIMHKYIKASVRATFVDNPSHALIELITDNELRVRLGGPAYPPFEGHPQNEPYRQKLLPSWRAYLKQPDKDIFSFLKSAEALFQEP